MNRIDGICPECGEMGIRCNLHDAAPELLEACRLALDVFYDRPKFPKPLERQAAADALRSAIAKAERGTNHDR